MHTAEAGILCRELAACQAMFLENRVLARRIAGALTIEQFNWQPTPEQWSVAQCLVHLNISAALYAEAMTPAIRAGRSARVMGSGPFRYGPLARWMLRAVSPDNPRRHRTPARFVAPATTSRVRDVLDAFEAAGARWERLLYDANGLDLARVKVRSPAISLLTLPLGALFDIQAAHERRHLRQAERVVHMQTR